MGVGDELEGDGLQLRGRAPVGVVAHQIDAIRLYPVHEFEGTGADGRLLDALDAFRCHDDRVAPGEVEEHVAVGLGEGDLHGQRIDDLHRGDGGVERLLRIGAVGGIDPVEGEFHVLGVHGCAVVESHAVMQLEGIGQPVVGNLPAFRQSRHHGAVGGKAGEPFEDVGIEHGVDGAGGRGGRVEVRRFKLHRDGDV